MTIAQSPAQDSKFIVIDIKDNMQATRTVYATKKAATKAADRLDNIYGGYRYSVKAL